MLPNLEKAEANNGYHIFSTSDQVVGLGVHLTACDVEAADEEVYVEKLSSLFRQLNPSLRLRFISKSQTKRGELSVFPRSEAFERLDFREQSLFCVIEKSTASAFSGLLIPSLKPNRKEENAVDLLLDAARSLRDLGFETTPLSDAETLKLFVDDNSDWTADIGSVETGSKSIGVIRLVKPSSREVTPTTLSKILKEIGHDVEIRVCLERLSNSSAELFLQRRLKQVSRESKVGEMQGESLEDTLVSTSLSGESLLNYEFLIVMEKHDKGSLRKALAEVVSQLKPLGDFAIETIGCAPSLICSYPGSRLHVPVLEQEKTLPCFIPAFRIGEVCEFSGEDKRAVTLQREDQSLIHIDLLDPKHQNQNAVIIGTSGKGKSVALGVLTHSLLHDESVSVLKVDVGGSHSRECSMLGGVEYKLRIDQPSGLNPFALLSQSSDGSEFERSVLGQFLEVLILEEGEKRLSKTMRAELDQALEKYLSVKHKSSSLDQFVRSAGKSLPRLELFKRWVGTGLYQNAFRDLPKADDVVASDDVSSARSADSSSSSAASCGFSTDQESASTRKRYVIDSLANSSSSNASVCDPGAPEEFASTRKRQATRLRYLNFSEVFQASDPDFSTACMAAVLAMFNLELKLHPERRLVLVCDETPFFIEKCFEFFKFSTANVRKFGASVVLVVQLSKHLVVGGDTGVIENSNHRFLFSTDGSRDDYQSRLHLSDEAFERIESLKPAAGESKLIYQHQDSAQTLTLRLTREEYWRLTSTQSDRIKIDSLMRAVPDLKVEEAIRVLGRTARLRHKRKTEVDAG